MSDNQQNPDKSLLPTFKKKTQESQPPEPFSYFTPEIKENGDGTTQMFAMDFTPENI